MLDLNASGRKKYRADLYCSLSTWFSFDCLEMDKYLSLNLGQDLGMGSAVSKCV